MRPLGSPSPSPRADRQAPPPPRRRFRAAGVVLLATVALLALSGCAEEDRPNLAFPDPATEEAPRILLLWQGSWLAAIITGVIVWGLILWACLFHRKKSEDDIPIQTRYNLPIEVLYTVLPFIIIATLFYFTARDESILLDNDEREDLTVNVVGRQWSWTFNYIQDGVYDVGTPGNRPQLWLPSGKRVRFELTSPDVMHSFWVLPFLFKMDVIPGRVNAFELTPNKIGNFRGKCAEFCGTDHARMLFDVRVVSESDYRAHVEDLRRRGQEGKLPIGIPGSEARACVADDDDNRAQPCPAGPAASTEGAKRSES